jgi:hypothetical protein
MTHRYRGENTLLKPRSYELHEAGVSETSTAGPLGGQPTELGVASKPAGARSREREKARIGRKELTKPSQPLGHPMVG